MIVLVTTLIYFSLLLLISRLTGRGGNDAFFRGNRQSPWPLVAFGMIGATLSGVTFVSVPGMVLSSNMGYMQMCLGYLLGYFAIAFILLPIYYGMNLTSIYTYLDHRFGKVSYKTGASFFLLSKLTGAAARLYLVCLILQNYVFDDLGIPYIVTVLVTLLLIWLYTRKSGIRTLVWTDSLQTLCFIITILLILIKAAQMLDFNLSETWNAIWADGHSRIFEFSDWTSRNYFWKQFLSGIFIVIVMTGLDQDMMQKNLTCKNLKDAQKDMCVSGILFVPVIGLVMMLGVLMTLLYAHVGYDLPAAGDSLIPDFIASGVMGQWVLVFFTLGMIASAFSSADSALTALTTSFCIDILELEDKDRCYAKLKNFAPERVRKTVHIIMAGLFVFFIMFFKALGSTSVIDVLLTMVSYTYGPLLGMYTFGIVSNRKPYEKLVPWIAIASPIVCYLLDSYTSQAFGYKFGYELLILNGGLTYLGLYLSSYWKK